MFTSRDAILRTKLSQVTSHCRCVQRVARAQMYCGRQSHAAQRIPLDGTSTQILPFERTQISDKSRTNRHSRSGLLRVHQGMSNVPIRHPPGNLSSCPPGETTDGDTVKMGFRSLWSGARGQPPFVRTKNRSERMLRV